jgi:hypothetical protein
VWEWAVCVLHEALMGTGEFFNVVALPDDPSQSPNGKERAQSLEQQEQKSIRQAIDSHPRKVSSSYDRSQTPPPPSRNSLRCIPHHAEIVSKPQSIQQRRLNDSGR